MKTAVVNQPDAVAVELRKSDATLTDAEAIFASILSNCEQAVGAQLLS